MNECRLTTIDNPFDPFTQWDAWLRFDEDHGYHTCRYLADRARTSSALTPEENMNEIERAIDEIVRLNPLQIYKKVKAS